MFYLGSGDEHCAIHCAMDANNRCDYFYMFHGYCYLGSFNQVGGIGVHHCCPHLTVYMNKSKFAAHIFRAQSFTYFIEGRSASTYKQSFTFSWCINGTFPLRKCSVNSEENIYICY